MLVASDGFFKHVTRQTVIITIYCHDFEDSMLMMVMIVAGLFMLGC